VKNKDGIATLLSEINNVLADKTTINDGFLGGRLGTIFYYFYYSQVFDDAIIESRAREMLSDYIEKLNNDELNLNFSYCNGLAGFAYAMSHLYQTGMINIDMEDEFEDLDEMLFTTATELLKHHYNDFLHGSFGIFHYFASRNKTEKIRYYVDELVKVLDEHVITLDHLSCIANLSLPSNQVKENINLSFSHGLNGFVIVLLNMLEGSSQKDTILRIVEKCTRFINNTYESVTTNGVRFSNFPSSIGITGIDKKFNNRLGWCYGDLGQLLLFHRISKTSMAGNISFPLESAVSDMTDRKSYESNLVEDSHFCHGSSGLAHFYCALYKESGNKAYDDAYNYWMDQTVTLLARDLKSNAFKDNEHSILDGFPGIGLTLLSYISDEELAWGDAVLLG
jgi:hypothetical protein